jgi:oligopeptide transport system substrate-binding protein
MTRKAWLGVALLATGVTLLTAAGFAAAATSSSRGVQVAQAAHAKTGLTMNIDLSSTDFDYLDPALAYADWSWQFTYLMNCKLLNYPDKNAPEGTKLQPEAADFPVVSNGGKVYTFTIKSNAGGCKFNTGEKVTAQSFADAINRDLNPAMASPAVQFISDIVGASDVAAGKATTASGVNVSGNKLIITLTKPGADFLARINLPFFAAIPHGMPVNGKGETTYGSAGPYYVVNWTQGRSAEFDRNPNYTGPRPHTTDRFRDTINTDHTQSCRQLQSGLADYDDGGLPPEQ